LLNEFRRDKKKEFELSTLRMLELRVNPIIGGFDAAHLKAIRRYFFQDLPKAGVNHIPLGIFREESSKGKY
jgi:fido (protein-threonine AMPylation protein)